MKKAVGFQSSVWDQYRNEFPIPGDFVKCALKTEEGQEGLTGAQASQFAKRMEVLHPGVYFHSGIDKTVTPHKVFVRRREEGWKPSEKKAKDDQPPLPGTGDNEDSIPDVNDNQEEE